MGILSRNRWLGVGPKGPDITRALAPAASRGMFGVPLLGGVGGYSAYILTPAETTLSGTWKKDQLNSASSTLGFVGAHNDPIQLRVSTSATNHHGYNMQLSLDGGTTAHAPFYASATRNLGMRFAFKTSEATSSGIVIGLAPVDTTLLGAGSAIDQNALIGLYKAPGAADATIVLRNGGTSTTVATFAIANDTWYTVDLRLEGRSQFSVWINGVQTATGTMTNLPTDATALAPSIAFAANNKTLSVSQMTVWQEQFNA